MKANRMVGLSSWAAFPTSTDQFSPAKRFDSEDSMSGIIGQNGAEQRHGETNAADDGVFPCGLKRRFAAVKRDEEHRRQCGSFDGDPEHSQIVGQSDQNHGKNKQRHEGVVFAQFLSRDLAPYIFTLQEDGVLLVVAEIADGIDGA